MFIRAESQETTVTMFDQQVAAAKKWFASPRFAGIVRLYHLLFKARWARPESSPVQATSCPRTQRGSETGSGDTSKSL
jgi:hypothetical protein